MNTICPAQYPNKGSASTLGMLSMNTISHQIGEADHVLSVGLALSEVTVTYASMTYVCLMRALFRLAELEVACTDSMGIGGKSKMQLPEIKNEGKGKKKEKERIRKGRNASIDAHLAYSLC